MPQQQAEAERAADHAEQHHDAEQRHHPRQLPRGRQIGRQRQPGRLHRVHARTHQQEGEGRARLADPERPVHVTGQIDQREWHDGQTAELQQRADPQIGDPPPAEHRAVDIGFEADQRAERGGQQRQRDHDGHQPGRHVQFHDHDAVQRADQQGHGNADGDLEQRQP
jgi:hypothetical protein